MDENYLIEISDNGVGIHEKHIPRLFERFYRVDKTGAIPGNGLGLSITREIMGLMNGQISISSVPRQGTEVTLLFPVSDDPAVMLPAAAAAQAPVV
jgi:signal transduction histidine kinase